MNRSTEEISFPYVRAILRRVFADRALGVAWRFLATRPAVCYKHNLSISIAIYITSPTCLTITSSFGTGQMPKNTDLRQSLSVSPTSRLAFVDILFPL